MLYLQHLTTTLCQRGFVSDKGRKNLSERVTVSQTIWWVQGTERKVSGNDSPVGVNFFAYLVLKNEWPGRNVFQKHPIAEIFLLSFISQSFCQPHCFYAIHLPCPFLLITRQYCDKMVLLCEPFAVTVEAVKKKKGFCPHLLLYECGLTWVTLTLCLCSTDGAEPITALCFLLPAEVTWDWAGKLPGFPRCSLQHCRHEEPRVSATSLC